MLTRWTSHAQVTECLRSSILLVEFVQVVNAVPFSSLKHGKGKGVGSLFTFALDDPANGENLGSDFDIKTFLTSLC